MAIIPIMFLILMLINIYVLIFAFSQSKRRGTCHLAFGLNLITFIILYSLTIELPSMANESFLFSVMQMFQNLSTNVYIIILLIILAGSISLLYWEKKYLKESITRTSIKESIDNLPMGLCFSTNKGIVLLSNRSMNQLCYRITGRELQDGEYLWQKITEKRKEFGDNSEANKKTSIIQFDDGETWSFSRSLIKINRKDGIQIIAINITELYELQSQLKNKNIEFTKMNIRLQQYSENLADIKSGEERLSTKIQLHNELGYILLATRKAIANKNLDVESKSIFALWRQNIAALLSGRGPKEINVFKELSEAALDIGIKLRLKGKLPRESNSEDLILKATIEALNNAARHAEATELNLAIKERETEYKICLTNDGILPEKEIIEGGGLSALRGKVEGQGGSMGIDTEPIFKLCIAVPRQKEVHSNDKSIDSGR